jgi:hypothetical protein
VEIVEMDEELYLPDDVLEEASAARYQMPKKIKIMWLKRCAKIYTIMREWKPVTEKQWAKNDEQKWSERKRNLHPLVTMDTDSLSREESNKNVLWILKKTKIEKCQFITLITWFHLNWKLQR